MTETQRLESLLAGGNGGAVTLPRKDARELAQKLKARGEAEVAATLVERLETPGDVTLTHEEAQHLRDRLQASGRRWVFGTNEPRPLPSMTPPEREPEPDLRPTPGFFTRLFGRGDE
jgi:hypothetical protein